MLKHLLAPAFAVVLVPFQLLGPATVGAALVGAALAAPPVAAQYFGQNKVQYRHLDFQVIQTEHFEVHYYQGLRDAAVDAGRMAERAYARLSRVLNHQYRERQPLILFASHTEFQQNNVTDISEGTGGVTDPFRHRAMLPFTGAYRDFDHVLQHELVHQFQFDIFARGRIGAGIQRLVAVNPPLWFMEGMAEYLSLGPIDASTAMWLRDAALEGRLPTIEQLTFDPRVFPYRFGHALLAYVGERWGDEVIGEILHGVATSGIEQGFRRALGISLSDLSDEWRDAVRRTYLPQITDLRMARQFSRAVLTEEKSTGTLHVSPAISPDGSQIAYLSEGSTFFVDLYLADAQSGRVKRRLIKSAFSSNFESLRFINSAGSWSPDGRYFAIAAKHGGHDDLVIFDVQRNRVHRRIDLALNGLVNPAWSPDGTRLVFTGYDQGWSDLFVIDADGTNLARLTHDRYADLHAAWSPDGKSIAFATDRGPSTDLATLKFGGTKIALYHLDTQAVEVLSSMTGANINPQWAPDGKSIAFVSDRNGTHNLYLYDFGDQQVYQLTHVYTGIASFTPFSPAISWAQRADRLVFTYFEKGAYNVYAVDNPRALKRQPYQEPAGGPPVASLTQAQAPRDGAVAPAATGAAPVAALAPTPVLRDGGAATTAAAPSDTTRTAAAPADVATSVYRAASGFRSSAEVPAGVATDSGPISVKALLDSATLALPDTAEFGFKKYRPKLATDFIAQPSVGYTRDNFGNGVYGGAAVSFSDILGNQRLLVGAQVNGRIEEAQVIAAYANLGRRTNWAGGYQQNPVFFFSGSELGTDPATGLATFTVHLERFLYHQGFIQAAYPFTRFRRVEFGLSAVNVTRANQNYIQYYHPVTRVVYDAQIQTERTGQANYLQPSAALVFDNSISEWVGPTMGRRNRLAYAPAFGNWMFHELTLDYRRYDSPLRPLTLATRTMFFGRFGRDTDQFRYFLGWSELLRGYTSGSFRRNECLSDRPEEIVFCDDLDQLIGSRVALFNAELRFPLIRNLSLGLLPVGFPPIEGAVFFDIGMAWNGGNQVVWRRAADANKRDVRTPLKSYGFSIRANLGGFVIFRLEYSKPLDRGNQSGYWTLNIGPTF
ncbi:MAG: PD40 domain-containing protein [Gemmatimonadetes bacterium]|nr:PD40 domain-containing protein [Gemmatimonadota bacterium]